MFAANFSLIDELWHFVNGETKQDLDLEGL
jgi:hypothetical protein